MATVAATVAIWSVLFYRSGFGQNAKYAFPESPIPLVGQWVVPPMLPVVTILCVSTAALVSVSLCTPPPSSGTLSKFFRD
jgi:hypothetical protein